MIAVGTPHHVAHTPPRARGGVQPLEQRLPETYFYSAVNAF
jgi:hypothetical protein